jgi:hypothetical protein
MAATFILKPVKRRKGREVSPFNPQHVGEKEVDEPPPRLVFTDEILPEVSTDCIAGRTVRCIMNTGIESTIVPIPKNIKRKIPNPSIILFL